MVDTPFRITPSLGPDLTQVAVAAEAGTPLYDSPQLGTVVEGSDGRRYIRVEASGTITDASAPGTQVSLTVTAYDDVTAAGGSGGWYAPPTSVYGTDLLEGDRFWAAKGTAP